MTVSFECRCNLPLTHNSIILDSATWLRICLSPDASTIECCRTRHALNHLIFCTHNGAHNSCIWVRLVGGCIPFDPFQNATLMDPHFPMFIWGDFGMPSISGHLYTILHAVRVQHKVMHCVQHHILLFPCIQCFHG